MKIMLCVLGYLAIGGVTLVLLIRDCIKEGSYTPDDASSYLFAMLIWPGMVLLNVFYMIVTIWWKKVIIAIAALFDKEKK